MTLNRSAAGDPHPARTAARTAATSRPSPSPPGRRSQNRGRNTTTPPPRPRRSYTAAHRRRTQLLHRERHRQQQHRPRLVPPQAARPLRLDRRRLIIVRSQRILEAAAPQATPAATQPGSAGNPTPPPQDPRRLAAEPSSHHARSPPALTTPRELRASPARPCPSHPVTGVSQSEHSPRPGDLTKPPTPPHPPRGVRRLDLLGECPASGRSAKNYPRELKDRAMAMVREVRPDYPSEYAAIEAIAPSWPSGRRKPCGDGFGRQRSILVPGRA